MRGMSFIVYIMLNNTLCILCNLVLRMWTRIKMKEDYETMSKEDIPYAETNEDVIADEIVRVRQEMERLNKTLEKALEFIEKATDAVTVEKVQRVASAILDILEDFTPYSTAK